MFNYDPHIHDEDDIIEYILNELIKRDWAGGCFQVPDSCRISSYDYDRFMEPMVREKMYRHGVAKRCIGANQDETAVMITPKGIKTARNGGWKMYLKIESDKKQAEINQKLANEHALRDHQRIEAEKSKLETEKTKLEMEKLVYEKENRTLTEEVQRLTALNLKIQSTDIVGKWIFALIGFLISLFASIFLESELKLISKLGQILVQLLSFKD